jgi:hypothetical protein
MPESISVCPQISKGMFQNNNMSFISLLKEFIDNSVAEMVNTEKGFTTIVDIILQADFDSGQIADNDIKTARLIIKDNSVGIRRDRLKDALSIGKAKNHIKNEESLHEHGVGMKVALWSLGNLDYLITKTSDEVISSKIENDIPIHGEIEIKDDNYFKEDETGTIICITNITI